jgi:hypothetical protein
MDTQRFCFHRDASASSGHQARQASIGRAVRSGYRQSLPARSGVTESTVIEIRLDPASESCMPPIR